MHMQKVTIRSDCSCRITIWRSKKIEMQWHTTTLRFLVLCYIVLLIVSQLIVAQTRGGAIAIILRSRGAPKRCTEHR